MRLEQPNKAWKWTTGLCLIAATAASVMLLARPGDAMNMNLNLPYGSKPSPPHTADVCFFSRQSETLLFGPRKEIEITCHAAVRSVALRWALVRNVFVKPFAEGDGEALPANNFTIHVPTEKLHPGFYDLTVQVDSGDPNVSPKGICTFGYRVEDMEIVDTRPADFREFWKQALDELAKVPLDANAGPVQAFAGKEIDEYNLQHASIPGDYDPNGHRAEEVEAFKVSFASTGGLRVHGWVAKPKGPGPFPVMLVLPGGGVNARPIPLEHARHGYLTMDIQIHGQDVDQAKYDSPSGYSSGQKYDPPTDYYYYKVVQHCVQAVNYLASRPDTDVSRIMVVGGSQGGRLGIMLAGLDARVKAVVAAIPNAGHMAYWTWAVANNPALEHKPKPYPAPTYDGMDRSGPPVPADTPANRCLPYYDPMNFAPDVHCPVLMNGGLIDYVSPPSCVYAIYARLGTKDKQIVPLPGLGHDWSPEFDRRAWRWLEGERPAKP